MARIGLIYGYRDPISQRWLYVGSVHEQTTLNRRHQQHLKEGKGLLGPWLCNFTNGQEPSPQVLQCWSFENTASLLEREDYWMDELETRFVNGGFNRTKAQGPDYSAMGRIGGLQEKKKKFTFEHQSKAGRAGALKLQEIYSVKERRQWAVKRGRAGGVKGGKKRQELYPELSSKMAKALPRNLGNHFRWHTSRGVVKDDCVFCFCEKSLR